jgi:predicted thioesterase
VALELGLSARQTLVVGTGDTAEALRSGSVPVLGTPRLIALCEEASCLAIDPHLSDGTTTVAKRLQFDHLVPVGVGGTVVAEATLDRIEGRRLIFTLSVSESGTLVAAGKLVRVTVDKEQFLSNVR